MKPANFQEQNEQFIEEMANDEELRKLTDEWMKRVTKYEYSYHFRWLGRPIIQYPQDIVAMQELIWEVQPDLIIETGIARGGSIVFYASMLELLGSDGEVVGIDIDIRDYNRPEIEQHPMHDRITMIEGSSTNSEIVDQVGKIAEEKQQVMVVLDSNHTHDHVLKELEQYAEMVTKGSYMVVFDTFVENMPANFASDRPWESGNNPMTAVTEFLETTDRFKIEDSIENKLLITVAPSGYLKCVSESD